jgi:TonB family protein
MKDILFLSLILTSLISTSAAQTSQATQSPDVIKSNELNAAAVKLFEEGKYDEALPLETQAMELREKALGDSDPTLIPLLTNLGEMFKRKDQAQAGNYFKRALKLAENSYGHDDLRITPIIDTLAFVEYELKHTTTSEDLFARSLKIKEARLGAQDPQIADTAFNLGEIYTELANYKAAAPLFSRAITIWEGAGEQARQSLLKALERQVLVFTALGKSAEADKLQIRIAELSTSSSATRVIDVGVLNGKALALITPVYPEAAISDRASGQVKVEVLIDETGKVISAKALNGTRLHPALVSAAEKAALKSRFTPTLVSGQAVRVHGIIIYNFVAK